MKLQVYKCDKFSLVCNNIASDKSISHRVAIFSLLSNKPSYVRNYLQGDDTLHTLKIAQMLGLSVAECDNALIFTPQETIQEPLDVLDCGNAGTAIRLYMGLLSSQKGMFVLSGDKYLNKRPMKRVISPLKSIGAKIYGREDNSYAPIVIHGGYLESFNYASEISSAQVKSAMILAALFAKDSCIYSENELSRDHTEKMLVGMGAEIETIDKNTIKINPLKEKLKPIEIEIPSDPSSAFFFAVAVSIIPNSNCILKNVLLNKTRIEAFKILEKMGVIINYKETSNIYDSIGDIEIVSPKKLFAVDIKDNISWLIDELPALAIALSCANGISSVRNAKELRVKESDRISAISKNLKQCGIEVEELEDGFIITGGIPKCAKVDSFGDHRIAMSFAILGLQCGIEIEDSSCISVSFPNFVEILKQITRIEFEG